jgi:hypothetical protein
MGGGRVKDLADPQPVNYCRAFQSTKQTVRPGNQQYLPLLNRASHRGAAIRLSIAARATERAKPLGSSHRVPYIDANPPIAQSAVWPQLHTCTIIFARARHPQTVSSLFWTKLLVRNGTSFHVTAD